MQGILAGRYRLDRQLGKGGMGSVWLAEHLALNSWVAVKLMDPAIAATVEGAERFKREAQAAASLRSAHVVQVLDYGVHETTPFLVMELLQGESLADCLERERRLSPARTLAIITQVARAIGRAHAGGIVHRDLKPDNIFLVREDDQELAKVLDFGIAKTTGPRFGGMETRTGVTMGTPYYMSPEQVEGKKALDHRADLWSLAVIACECMTGVRPFDGQTYGELLLNICARPISPPSSQGLHLPGFDAWFAKAANRDPAQRFDSAQAMAAALADVVAGRAPAAATSPERTVAMGPQTAAFSGAIAAQTANGAVTHDPLELRVPVPRRNGWLFALGAVLFLGVGLGLWLKFRPKGTEGERATATAISPSSAETPSAPPVITPAAPSAESGAKQAHKPLPIALPAESSAGNEQKNALSPSSTAKSAPAASSGHTTAKLERCYADPFTGQIRVAGASHATDGFACRQNAFTGAYQRQ